MFQIGDVCAIVNAGQADGRRVAIISEGYLIDGAMRFRVELDGTWPPHDPNKVYYAFSHNLRYDSRQQKTKPALIRTVAVKETPKIQLEPEKPKENEQRGLDTINEWKGVAQLNREIWSSLHPDPPPYLWTKKHAAVKPDAQEIDEEEEDWRPYFLRRIPIPSRDWTESEAATYQTYDYFKSAQVALRKDIRCSDESGDDWSPYEELADEEPRIETKVTDRLLQVWHRGGYRWG